MKKFIPVAALAVCLFAAAVYAAGETPVSQTGARQDASFTVTGTAAINTQVVVTIQPGPGCIYVTEIDFTMSEDGTAGDSATNLTFATTGLGGWTYKFSAATGAANVTMLDKSFIFPLPLKALPSTAVTITSPAGKAHAIYNVNAAYFYAPCA